MTVLPSRVTDCYEREKALGPTQHAPEVVEGVVLLERKAASFASLDLAARLRAIVEELLAVTAPVAQVFWRRRFVTEATFASLALRPALRRFLCERIRRRYTATKQHRQQLINIVVHTLALRSSAAPQPQICAP